MLIFSNAVQLMMIVVEASVAHHLTIVAEVKIIADKVKINKYDEKTLLISSRRSAIKEVDTKMIGLQAYTSHARYFPFRG